jgi:hypothetical protein
MLGLRKILRLRRLSPFFTFSQKGNIWRMFFNDPGIAAGETRDIDSKNTYFFSLDSVNRKVLFRELQLEEKWWVSVCGINSNFVFVSGYKKPDMPELQGITAISLAGGTIQWKKDDLVFFSADDRHVYAYKQLFETKKYYVLQAETGNQEYEASVETILEAKAEWESGQYKDFIYPGSIPPLNGIRGLTLDVKIEGPVEYARFKNYIIYNYHADLGVDIRDITRKRLSNRLFIFDIASNRNVYKEVLNHTVSSYVPDSFFIRKDRLFYVKEKKELVCVLLSF